MLKILAVLAAMTNLAVPAAAQALTIPSPEDAKGAVIRMMNDPAMAKLMVNGHVKLGTCKKTTKAAHDGEVACTLAVVMGAGSSETQANFYRLDGKWVAEPTEEDLPFPDPKVR